MSGSSIPASAIVAVTPSVLSAGGRALDLNGLMLTTNTRVPIGTVPSFPSLAEVQDYFGPASAEASAATVYFNGFQNSTVKPGALLFSQYPQSAVGAYLRGGDVSGLTLTQLQALTGVLTVTIDGVARTSTTINLASATSFSVAALMIAAALNTWATAASYTASITGTTMTVTAVASGTLAVGQVVTGAGVQTATVITAFGTGSGGTGTYTVVSALGSNTISSQAMVSKTSNVTYDSQSGAFQVASTTTGPTSTIGFGSGTISAGLKLTAATGAVTSQGAAATDPATAMTAITRITQNWCSFMTLFDPDNGSGNAARLAFAAWANGQGNRYLYVAWDSDQTPTTSNAATTSLGYLVNTTYGYSGTCVVWSETQGVIDAAFVLSYGASLDFTETNGRTTAAFRRQTGLPPAVTDQTIYTNLLANGYNVIGRFATANDTFTFMYPGSVSGPFTWLDTYVDQIWLSNQFQLALMELLVNTRSIPYNAEGYAMIANGCADVIIQAGNFGIFRPGVTLSEAQKAEVNFSAGVAIDRTLSNQGWYLQIKDASPQTRQARRSPPMKFWYMDGESVQSIALNSVTVQ